MCPSAIVPVLVVACIVFSDLVNTGSQRVFLLYFPVRLLLASSTRIMTSSYAGYVWLFFVLIN